MNFSLDYEVSLYQEDFKILLNWEFLAFQKTEPNDDDKKLMRKLEVISQQMEKDYLDNAEDE